MPKSRMILEISHIPLSFNMMICCLSLSKPRHSVPLFATNIGSRVSGFVSMIWYLTRASTISREGFLGTGATILAAGALAAEGAANFVDEGVGIGMAARPVTEAVEWLGPDDFGDTIAVGVAGFLPKIEDKSDISLHLGY